MPYLLLVLLALIVPAAASAQSPWITNPSAEEPLSVGWTITEGTSFDIRDNPPFGAIDGTAVFWAGQDGVSGAHAQTLSQLVDLSSVATAIDAGEALCTFSGYGLSSNDGTNQDNASVFLHYLSATGSVLATFASGVLQPANEWRPFGETRVVPFGTRSLRIELRGQRSVGISTDAYFDSLQMHVQTPATSAPAAGIRFALGPAVPNPFNPRTTISYSLSQPGRARIVVFDLAGRAVRRLVDGNRESGTFEVVWDGRDDAGRRVPSGAYVARLQAGGDSVSRKLLLAK